MKRGLKTAAALLCLTLAFWLGNTSISLALGSAKVVANSGIIREKASKDSKQLASVKKDNKLDVISQTSDSNGYTWYKVYIDGEKTGYVRADVVTVEGTIPAETASNSDSNTSSSTSSSESSNGGGNVTVVGSNSSTTTTSEESGNGNETAAVSVSETDVATAKTNSDVRVREGAGTNTDTVTTAKKDTTVTVSGVAADSDGKNWYQISYNSGDKTVNGFIREDFLEVLERVEAPVEETPAEEIPEEAAPEEPVNRDYELEYRDNGSGTEEWFLQDNIQGTSQSLAQLLNVAKQVENGELKSADSADTMQKIIIALAVVLFILVVAVTILGFKLHDAYEYEYVDEEEEEEEEEDEPEEELIRAPRKELFKKKETAPVKETKSKPVSRPAAADMEEEPEEAAPKKPAGEGKKSWQSKDFLELDDDMEFEFLDL